MDQVQEDVSDSAVKYGMILLVKMKPITGCR